MKHFAFFTFLFFSATTFAQIKSGPMLGYNTMREVAVWVQTEKPLELEFSYHEKDSIPVKKIYRTEDTHGNTVSLIADYLKPGTTYFYSINSDNKTLTSGKFTSQRFWQNEADLPVFSFATGSCAYLNEKTVDRKGEPFGKNFGIFASIEAKAPDFMLWLGDNIYLRDSDFGSKSGIYRRYTQFKSHPQLQSFWKNMHHYAIWDDHDFGPNDADRSFYNKDITTSAFKNFWANQTYGVANGEGICSQFSYYDLDFFLLDNRFFRSPNDRKSGEKTILGKDQIEWLIDALINSKASFKIIAVGGQFLNPAKVWENYSNYEEERMQIIDLIEKEEIKNVIFVSGDRHKTELSKLQLTDDIIIYDYTCSPLASKAFDSKKEGNTLSITGTDVSTQNFGIIKLKNDNNQRVIVIKTYNAGGELLWSEEIKQQ